MRLSQLLHGMSNFFPIDPFIGGLCQDSRLLKPGDLFFAYPGEHVDGRHFIKEAIDKGASAILLEGPVTACADVLSDQKPLVPVVPIFNLRALLGPIAARFYDHPSRSMRICGITGTNGKTSCTHFLADCLQKLKKSCGIIGTLGNGIYGCCLKSGSLTTPDAIELHRLLAEFRFKGVQMAAMEVSSHRLAQQGLNETQFSIAAFTNLTRDHLDYHGTIETYAAAKRSFFDLPGIQAAILSADDFYGRTWAEKLSEKFPVYMYSLYKPIKKLAHLSYIAVTKHYTGQIGLKAVIQTPWGEVLVQNPFLIGSFNLSNILLVMIALKIWGFSLEEIVKAIKQLRGVRGRMQTFRVAGKALTVVDYAHTPDALEQTLKVLRLHCKGKLYCIFGCGGNRDRGKRALMGKIAEKEADYLVLTNDNPRYEEPTQIIRDIRKGLKGIKHLYVELDRRQAIQYVLKKAKSADVVLIAGKGHETYQLVKGVKYPFDDSQEVQMFYGIS